VPVLRGGSGARCPDRRMKLLFDQNLSFKLCTLLSDLFPDSKPVRELGHYTVSASTLSYSS
jgi:hypothetical protein